MERFDAVVIGAGPAGSTAAYRLAKGGASVLLLDKARFPRDKPCGGGLTGRALRLLPFSVAPVVEDATARFEFRLAYRGRSRFVRESPRPLAVMTQRRRLDAFLAEQAAAAGADFRDGVKTALISVAEGAVSLTVDGHRVAAAALVGADGVNGITARALGLGGRFDHGVALEGNVPYGEADRARFGGVMVLELGIVPGGYGWVFPKGDHVNVGVGGWESEGPRLREHLRRLCAEHGLGERSVRDLRGFRLPLRRPGSQPARGRALLVGDAAGLVDPLTGDGMFEAFLSSKLASEAVLDLLAGRAAGLEPYPRALSRSLAPLESASWGAKIAFDRFPRLAYGVARLPVSWRMAEKVLGGEVGHPGEARGLVRVPLKVLELLARAAGDPGRPYRLEAQSVLR